MEFKSSRRQELGVVWNDGIQYEIIGKRTRGSFRKAMRDYGIEKQEIDRVIVDIDCDRDVSIRRGSHIMHFRAL